MQRKYANDDTLFLRNCVSSAVTMNRSVEVKHEFASPDVKMNRKIAIFGGAASTIVDVGVSSFPW